MQYVEINPQDFATFEAKGQTSFFHIQFPDKPKLNLNDLVEVHAEKGNKKVLGVIVQITPITSTPDNLPAFSVSIRKGTALDTLTAVK